VAAFFSKMDTVFKVPSARLCYQFWNLNPMPMNRLPILATRLTNDPPLDNLSSSDTDTESEAVTSCFNVSADSESGS